MLHKLRLTNIKIVLLLLFIALVAYTARVTLNMVGNKYEMKATITYQLVVSVLPTQNEASLTLKDKFKAYNLELSEYGHWTHELELYHISDQNSEIIVHLNYGQKLLYIKIIPAKNMKSYDLLHEKEKLLSIVVRDLEKTSFFELPEENS